MIIEFRVRGIPKPAGSKRAFMNPKTKRVVVMDDCRTSGDWKADVKAAAITAMNGRDPLTVPVQLRVLFLMPRRKSDWDKRGRVKDSAPHEHTVKPDVTKLLRCLEDSLTGIVWRDDALIWHQEASKTYSDFPGATVCVETEDKS